MLGQGFIMPGFLKEPRSADDYWHRDHETLDTLLAYWEAVEADPLRRWPDLMAVVAEDRRIPALDDRPETISADEVMWHVMQHEVRHTAQIAQMIRTLGYEPPSLGLVFLTMR